MSPPPRILALAGVVTILSLALFMLIAEDLLDGGGLISRDHGVLSWFISVRTDALVNVAKVLSAIGSFVGLAIFSVLFAVAVRMRGCRWPLALSPLAALVVAALASSVAKAYFGRSRPPTIVRATTVTSAAFPSGHATDAAACLLAASFVLALAVATRPRDKVLCLLGGLVGAGLVGLSRLVLAVHWFSDVVAGWALGTAIAAIVVTTSWYWVTRPRRGTRVPPDPAG